MRRRGSPAGGPTTLLAGILAVVILIPACGDPVPDPPPAPSSPEALEEGSDVLTVLAVQGRFDRFLRILEEAAPGVLLGAMATPHWDHTVFAPTDRAWAALDQDALEALLANRAALWRVLDNHIFPAPVTTADLEPGELRTIGGIVEVEAEGATVTFGDATVTHPDLLATNGVVHGIDAVVTEVCLEARAGPPICQDLLPTE